MASRNLYRYTLLILKLIAEDNEPTNEVKRKISVEEERVFEKKRSLLINKDLSVKIEKSFIKTYVWSIWLHGCDAWTVQKCETERSKAIETGGRGEELRGPKRKINDTILRGKKEKDETSLRI